MRHSTRKPFLSRIPAWAAVLLATLAAATVVAAPTPESLRFSADVTVDLDTAFDDEIVVQDDLSGPRTAIDLGAIPKNADLDGYHLLAGGDQLFSVDATVTLPGGVTAGRADVVRYDGSSHTLELVATDHALPPGVDVDAISIVDGDLLVSFDTSVSLPAEVVQDEDLVRRVGGVLSLFFDGSAAGVPPGLGVDGAHHVAEDGHLLLSFDGSGTVGGVFVDDEDVLEYDPSNGSWIAFYDGSAEHPSWPTADLDALHVSFPAPAVPIFADGFESGDCTAWSMTIGGCEP